MSMLCKDAVRWSLYVNRCLSLEIYVCRIGSRYVRKCLGELSACDDCCNFCQVCVRALSLDNAAGVTAQVKHPFKEQSIIC
jgi:hypothetical protein